VTFWIVLAGMVAVTFGSRYAGLALRADLPAFWVRFLHFVPIAVFASLVTPYLEGDLGEWGIRVTAAAVAALPSSVPCSQVKAVRRGSAPRGSDLTSSTPT